ncbi:MAG: Fic family protein [Campylobacterales bacterium]|nr:Fic family protein [Campylobacterales bacterium]
MYKPPYNITTKIINQISEISELVADIKYIDKNFNTLKLRKKNRVRSITGTLQIEGNTFDEEKVTSVINGKSVLGTMREIEEVKGAIEAYDYIEKYDFKKEKDLLLAHKFLMKNLLQNAGKYRQSNVGVGGKDGVTHVAPPPNMVPELMGDLFDWLKNSDEHPLIKSCVFHYEFEFIHPFSDGNGRIGRLWQSVILKSFKDFFIYMPIESIVRENQARYYQALEDAGSLGESTPFIEFMLEIIVNSLKGYIKETKKSDQKSSLKSDQKILSEIGLNNQLTIKELCSILDMSESGVKKVIKKLKDEGKLQRVGSLKSGHWEIKDEI